MDFYQIGAMNVFSQLGLLIEEDERNQIKLSDLPSEVMEQIGSYLLEDKNKKIHKIFKNRPDDDLQVLLVGEVKDLTCINIYSSDNEIDYPMNYKLLDYVNYILKVNGIKLSLEKKQGYNSEKLFLTHCYNNCIFKIWQMPVQNLFYLKLAKQDWTNTD